MNIKEQTGRWFIDPTGSDLERTENFLRRALELVLANNSEAAARPPMPIDAKPFGAPLIPEGPLNEEELFENLREILTGSMNPASPGYIGHMDTIPAAASIAGDLLAAAVNNNMLSLEMSPAFSRLENALVGQVAKLFGLGEKSGGVMLAGGSLANLQALAVARNARFDPVEKGISGLGKRPVIYASEAAHASVQKAAMLLGLGTSSVVKIATDKNSRMSPEDLREKLAAGKSGREAPFCVVATAGTTVTGNIDPLEEIARIARENGLWFHVDAAYGGALVFSEKHRPLLSGIELADSVTFNPQKWLYVAKTCAMALFKDKSILQRAFRTSAPYMRETRDFQNIGEISVQGTHHADVLKLWLTLLHFGVWGCGLLIDECFGKTAYFLEKIKTFSYLKLAAEPELNIVCFRFAPEMKGETELDELNSRLQEYLLREAGIFLSLPLYRGSRWLRAVLLNPFTGKETIDKMFAAVEKFAAAQRVLI